MGRGGQGQPRINAAGKSAIPKLTLEAATHGWLSGSVQAETHLRIYASFARNERRVTSDERRISPLFPDDVGDLHEAGRVVSFGFGEFVVDVADGFVDFGDDDVFEHVDTAAG